MAKQLLDHLIYQHHLVSPLHISRKCTLGASLDKVRTRISQQSTIQLSNIRPLDSQQDFFEQSTRFLSSVKNISQDNQKYRGRWGLAQRCFLSQTVGPALWAFMSWFNPPNRFCFFWKTLFWYSTLTPQWKRQGKYVWHAFMAKYNPFGLKGYFWRTIWTHSTCYEWCTCDKIQPSTTHLVWKGTCVRSPWAMTKHWDPTGLSSDLYHKDIHGYLDS